MGKFKFAIVWGAHLIDICKIALVCSIDVLLMFLLLQVKLMCPSFQYEKQMNVYNCRVYGVAFVTEILNGHSPAKSCFDVKKTILYQWNNLYLSLDDNDISTSCIRGQL